MRKRLLYFVVVILGTFPQILSAQENCGDPRYQDSVFQAIDVTSAVKYGENIQPTGNQELFVDIYEPQGDTLEKRPLLIFAFGGFFVGGSRESKTMKTLCQSFAHKGYVTASIDYRLTGNLIISPTERTFAIAILKATHDMRAAIRFFRKDADSANVYRIDPSRIYIGGNSAGGVTALHTAFLDKLEEIPAALMPVDTAGIGGIAGLSGNPGYADTVSGVINLAGALGDTAWIESGGPQILSLHGTNDATVPYGTAIFTVLGSIQVAEVDGSKSIHTKADSIGLDNQLYPFVGQGHVPWENNALYMDTTLEVITDFLYPRVCTEKDTNTTGITLLDDTQIMVYPVPFSESVTFEWEASLSEKVSLSVMNLTGQEIYRSPFQQGNQIVWKPNTISHGLYFYRLTNHDGDLLHRGKLIAQ